MKNTTKINHFAAHLAYGIESVRRDLEFLTEAATTFGSEELGTAVEIATDKFAAVVEGEATMLEVGEALSLAWGLYANKQNQILGS